MKALSIMQPWVHAILFDGKDIENRSWRTKHRGWIALHASAKFMTGAKLPRGHKVPSREDVDCSAICGIARLEDVVTQSRSKWFQRPKKGEINYGWKLVEAKALKKPIPCKGTLGLWTVSPSALRAIKRQMPRQKFD